MTNQVNYVPQDGPPEDGPDMEVVNILDEGELFATCSQTGETDKVCYHHCPLCGDYGWLPGIYCRRVREAIERGEKMVYNSATGEKL